MHQGSVLSLLLFADADLAGGLVVDGETWMCKELSLSGRHS